VFRAHTEQPAKGVEEDTAEIGAESRFSPVGGPGLTPTHCHPDQSRVERYREGRLALDTPQFPFSRSIPVEIIRADPVRTMRTRQDNADPVRTI
jgi:hypothetical protein